MQSEFYELETRIAAKLRWVLKMWPKQFVNGFCLTGPLTKTVRVVVPLQAIHLSVGLLIRSRGFVMK